MPLYVQWQPQLTGQGVARAQWNDAERHRRAHQSIGHAGNGAIPTGGNADVTALPDCLVRQLGQALAPIELAHRRPTCR